MEVRYFINEKNIKKEFGVYVTSSAGILDLPKLKESTSQSWNEYHGTVVSMEAPKLQDREITLECFVNAINQFDFIQQLNLFYSEFLKSGFKRLRIEVGDDTPPLIYDCILKDTIKITKKWNAGSQQGTFSLKLTEPNPQKKILKFVATESNKTCVFNIVTLKSVIVTWGDNTRTDEIFSDGFELVHTYENAGVYYISIAGVISEINSVDIDETNTEIVWEIL